MRGRIWGFLAILMVFSAGMFAAPQFSPSEDEIQLRYIALSLAQKTPVPEKYQQEMPFRLPAGLLSAIPRQILLSQNSFRLPNIIIGAAAIVVLMVWGTGPAIVALITPWFWYLVLFDFPGILTLLLTLLIVTLEVKLSDRKSKYLLIGLLAMMAAVTSLPGLLFLPVFGMGLGLFNRKKIGLTIITLVIFVIAGIGVRTYAREQLFTTGNGITMENSSSQVDQRVRIEYRTYNFQDIVPISIKRLVYNKYYFWYRSLVSQWQNPLSLEKLVYPAEADATVSRGMWNSKGMPWIMFWEIPLILWGIYQLGQKGGTEKQIAGMFFVWGITGMYLFSGNFLANGIGLIIAVTMLAAAALKYLPKYIFYPLWVIIIIGLIPTYNYFYFNELAWRDNRPKVHTEMAIMAAKYNADYVTTILGRSFFYYAWENKLTAKEMWDIKKIKFDHFDLQKKSVNPGKVYVGLPGEFLGSKKADNNNEFKPEELPANFELLDAYHTRDTVSFGNGDYVWAVKVN